MCLGHSNWTICTLLSQFHFPRGLILRKGNCPNSRNRLDIGVSVPGAFKLYHLHPVKPILFPKFSNFCTFILQKANSYYPRERRRQNIRKGNPQRPQPTVVGSQNEGSRNLWTPSTPSTSPATMRTPLSHATGHSMPISSRSSKFAE